VFEGRCTVTQALVRDQRVPALYLLPAAQTRDKADISIDQMVTVCRELSKMVDYVLIDSPAGIEHGFQAAVAPAERVLIVTTPDVSALRDADKVIYLLERDWKYEPWLVLNRYNEEMVLSGDMRTIDDVLDILAIDLLGVVPESSDVVISTDRGVPAVYNQSALVRQAYFNIAQRILGRNVPLMQFQKRGLFHRLRRIFQSA
jgi:septum site-determining protein MinD